jgi:thiamine pyrophosphate-dependent acetolactate synthase large subunit-like protein
MKADTRSVFGRKTMKELIRQYLNNGISRRDLMRGLGAAGLTASAAKTIVESLTPSPAMAQSANSGAVRRVSGTGGKLYIEQLKAAGTEFIFFNPSTGDAPIYDALVDMPEIQLIKGVQEGAVVAMADGYARVSGKIGVAHVANVGLPSGMTQLVNSWKDRIPVLLTVAAFSTEVTGRDHPQDYEHQEPMLAPITKSFWMAESTAGIADVTRRALKFGTTLPAGPVFLSIPDDLLLATGTADIYDGRLFNVAMKIRPDQHDVEAIAKLLIEARSPLITAGDEITVCQAEAEVVELANLLGIPVTMLAGSLGNWSKPYPTRDAQFVGTFLAGGHFPGPVDVHFNVGSQLGERRMANAITISMRSDPTGLARSWPIDMPIVANIKLGLADIIAAIKSMATADRLKQIADDRSVRTRDYTAGMAKMQAEIVRNLGNGSSITMERLGVELENGLDKETIFVTDCESGRIMDSMMTFGGTDKTLVSTSANILGWAQAAATGVKFARPNRPVVSAMGDGSAMFGGPQPLWSQARYNAPITNIVVNNRSYNNERNRILSSTGPQQFRTGKDMTSYNGSPDVDFTKAAAAYGVEGETVSDPAKIQEQLGRAKRANIDGRPYLLDILVDRAGVGSASEWYPPYSIAAKRTRKV